MEKQTNKLCRILSLLNEIESGAGMFRLRFNVPYIGVYWVADQFFCEKQVEISMKEGELEIERKKIGKDFHEKLSAGMEKTSREQVWSYILSGRSICVSDLLLVGKWKGIPIIGRADLLLFSRSKPLWLFEFKFTNMRIPSGSSHVQARLYSLLLKQMGFDVSTLKYAIVLAKEKPENFERWRRLVLDKVKSYRLLKEKAVVKINGCRVFIGKPKFDKAEKELNFALKYWLCIREAIPTKSASKCRACAYNASCDSRNY